MGIIVTGVVVVGAMRLVPGYYFTNVQPAEPAWEVYRTEGARVWGSRSQSRRKELVGEPGSVSADNEEKPS